MTDTPRQRRTAASIIDGIQHRLNEELSALEDANRQVSCHLTRIAVIKQIMADAEKNGESE